MFALIVYFSSLSSTKTEQAGQSKKGDKEDTLQKVRMAGRRQEEKQEVRRGCRLTNVLRKGSGGG